MEAELDGACLQRPAVERHAVGRPVHPCEEIDERFRPVVPDFRAVQRQTPWAFGAVPPARRTPPSAARCRAGGRGRRLDGRAGHLPDARRRGQRRESKLSQQARALGRRHPRTGPAAGQRRVPASADGRHTSRRAPPRATTIPRWAGSSALAAWSGGQVRGDVEDAHARTAVALQAPPSCSADASAHRQTGPAPPTGPSADDHADVRSPAGMAVAPDRIPKLAERLRTAPSSRVAKARKRSSRSRNASSSALRAVVRAAADDGLARVEEQVEQQARRRRRDGVRASSCRRARSTKAAARPRARDRACGAAGLVV